MGPQNLPFLEGIFMVNNYLVFGWPKPVFFWGFGDLWLTHPLKIRSSEDEITFLFNGPFFSGHVFFSGFAIKTTECQWKIPTMNQDVYISYQKW